MMIAIRNLMSAPGMNVAVAIRSNTEEMIDNTSRTMARTLDQFLPFKKPLATRNMMIAITRRIIPNAAMATGAMFRNQVGRCC